MPDLPSHSDSGAGQPAAPTLDSSRPPGARRRAVVIAVSVIVLLVVMTVLHVTGVVGAGTNG